jgi:hypothetical protein
MAGGTIAMENAPANAAISLNVAIGLENAMPPGLAIDQGMLLVDSTARLTVGADGRITDCRVTATNFHQGFPAELMRVDLCTFPAFQGKMFAAIPDRTQERVGLIRLEMHVRLGPPQAT